MFETFMKYFHKKSFVVKTNMIENSEAPFSAECQNQKPWDSACEGQLHPYVCLCCVFSGTNDRILWRLCSQDHTVVFLGLPIPDDFS